MLAFYLVAHEVAIRSTIIEAREYKEAVKSDEGTRVVEMATATLNKIRDFRRSRGDACQMVYKLEVGVDNYDHTEVSHPANRGNVKVLAVHTVSSRGEPDGATLGQVDIDLLEQNWKRRKFECTSCDGRSIGG